MIIKVSPDANRKIRSTELGIPDPDSPIHPSSENKNICNARTSNVILTLAQNIISLLRTQPLMVPHNSVQITSPFNITNS